MFIRFFVQINMFIKLYLTLNLLFEPYYKRIPFFLIYSDKKSDGNLGKWRFRHK